MILAFLYSNIQDNMQQQKDYYPPPTLSNLQKELMSFSTGNFMISMVTGSDKEQLFQ